MVTHVMVRMEHDNLKGAVRMHESALEHCRNKIDEGRQKMANKVQRKGLEAQIVNDRSRPAQQRAQARSRFNAIQQQITQLGEDLMAESARLPGLRHNVEHARSELRHFEARHHLTH